MGISKAKKERLIVALDKLGQTREFETYYTNLGIVEGRKISVNRNKQNLTQGQLAELAKVTQSTISRVEKGDPSVKTGTIDKINKALLDYSNSANKETIGIN